MAVGEFRTLLQVGCELRREYPGASWWGICRQFGLRIRADTKEDAWQNLQGLMIRAIRIGVAKIKGEVI